ncbi:MAG: phage tail spike protein [Aristaeellaceae bacterium]
MAVRLPRLLDSSMQELDRLTPESLYIEENLSPLSTATMVLPDGSCEAVTGQFVELYTIHGSAGIYRVQQAEHDYGGRITLALEHGLTTLGDGIMPGESEQTGSARELLAALLAHQPKTMWTLGTVAVPDSMTLTWKNDNSNLLESLCNLLDELPGYRLTFNQRVFPWLLNVEAIESADGCECRLSRNLSSLRVEEDRSELCTRLYVPGLSAPLDADTIGTFGIVSRVMDADPDIGEEELTKQGRSYLESHKTPSISVTMDAVDWYEATGEPFDRFTLGRVCRVCLPDYGQTIRQRVIGLEWPDVYGQPEQVTVKLASESVSAVDVMAGLIVDTTVTRKRFTADLKKQANLLIDAEESITLIANRIDLVAKEVNINAEQITLRASKEEVGELSRRVSAAEIAIDGANATISLKASQETVDELGTRVSAAEIAIDGANSTIKLKADKVKVDALETEIAGLLKVDELAAEIADLSSVSVSSLSVEGTAHCTSLEAHGASSVDGNLTVSGELSVSSLVCGGEDIDFAAYTKTGDLSSYAQKSWVNEQNFAKESYVTSLVSALNTRLTNLEGRVSALESK